MANINIGLLVLVVGVLQFDHVTAAVGRQSPASKPSHLAHIPGCYYISKDTVLPYGDTYPEGQCMKYTCEDSGEILFISCGSVGAGPGCEVVSDPSLRYPDCCPTVICDQIEDNDDSIGKSCF